MNSALAFHQSFSARNSAKRTLNLLPIGGFVKIFGENPDEENMNGPDSDRSFVNKAKWKQAIVLFAGIFANFILAWLLLSFGLMSGLPASVGSEPAGVTLSNVSLVVVSVAPKSPAEMAGLKPGDKIIDVGVRAWPDSKNYLKDPDPEQLKSFIISHASVVEEAHPLVISYMRNENDPTPSLAFIKKLDQSNPTIGISMDEMGTARLPFFKALYQGMRLDWFLTKSTAVGLYTLIWKGILGRGSLSAVTGPVGLVGIVGEAYKFGFAYLMSFAALISINLAIVNLIPFPALDGGRLLFILIEKIKGSRINPKVANVANLIGFTILILFMLVVTYHDVVKLF